MKVQMRLEELPPSKNETITQDGRSVPKQAKLLQSLMVATLLQQQEGILRCRSRKSHLQSI